MKTFNDCFYNSENHRGFIETFATIDNEKLTDLIGEHSSGDVRMYDIYLKSKIGFLNVSPLLETIDRETTTSLQDKQEETIKLFLMLRYSELLKVKTALITEISVNNGVIKVEDKNTTTTSKNSVSSFNVEDLEEDNENNYNNETDNTITEKNTDTETIVKNIGVLTEFYKQSIFDKIIDFVKDLFTLQVVE